MNRLWILLALLWSSSSSSHPLHASAVLIDLHDDVDHFAIAVTATPPVGASTRQFSLSDTAIVDRDADHRIYVELRRDFAAGVLHAPELIGVLDQRNHVLVVDRGAGSWTTGFHA